MQAATPGQDQTPPVLILVCNDTDTAEVFYRKISGEVEEDIVTEAEVAEVLAEEEDGNGARGRTRTTKPKKRVTYGPGAIFPELFSNTAAEKRTIRIDTKLLAEAESDDPNKRKQVLPRSFAASSPLSASAASPASTCAASCPSRCSPRAGTPTTSPTSSACARSA